MNKILKALMLVFLGLLIWIGLVYIALAFIKAELNPFIWSQTTREIMLFIIFIYIPFTPVMTMSLKDEL